jgi:predicted RNA-binding protein with PIN domain
MRWFIDGYNVIRRDPDLRGRESESLEAGRRALVHVLARAHREPRDEFTVVFDGARVSGSLPPGGRIRVVFSRPPMTADDELIRLARQWKSGAIVVSSDRKIQDAARRAGAAALSADQFLEGLEHHGGTPLDEADPASKEGDLEEPPATTKRGNPRRASKKDRQARRALRRLRRS